MEKLSRYILVLVAILVASIVLPELYWMAFDKPIRTPFVMYSCTDNDFMIYDTENMVRHDTRGNTYTREEMEEKLPLMYVRQLLMVEKMPDSINGFEMDMHEISKARSTFRYKPDDLHSPKPALYPMFESESGRANLEMPLDFFRINWRIEFIDAGSNKINEEKSRLFSAALYHEGFQFPATQISGIPTTRKSCDEGYLIIDNSEQLFHVKMIEGQPYVYKVNVPNDLKFKNISCVDFKDKRYYAYMISNENEVYILTQDDYRLVKLPIDGFNADNCELKIYGDFFHYNAIIQAEDHLKVHVLNKDYEKIDEYNKTWLKRSERTAGKIAAGLFPAQIKLTNKYSSYINFYTETSRGIWWMVINLLMTILHFGILLNRKANLKRHGLDLIIVALTGIFGFIAVNFFPNKFFK